MNNGGNIDDRDLLLQIRQGGSISDRATETLYRRHRNEVLFKVEKMIRYRKGQQADASDLVQDAYIIMLDKVRSEDYEEGPVDHFWIGIAHGLFRNKQKRDYRVTFVDDHSKIDGENHLTPETELENKERSEIFDQLLEKVGDKCKKIMKLVISGYSMREIAEKMELPSEGMARKTKYQCKKKLVELVKELNLEF